MKTATSKQDRTRPRTATELELKYGFGQSFAELYGLIDETQENTTAAIEELDKELDFEGVFNRLTNYGAIQSIYRQDNNIYINASYIKSGTLAANLIDAENLKVKAANIIGTLTAEQIDATDLEVNAANITGKLTAAQIDTSNLNVNAANITGVLDANIVSIHNLSADSISGGTLDASVVSIENLSASSITTGSMSANRITSGTMSANRISGGTIDATEVNIVNLDADNITAGILSADYIKLGGEMNIYQTLTSSTLGGYIGYGEGYSGDNGAVLSNRYNDCYFIATSSGVRMEGDGNYVYCSSGNVGASQAITVGSDRRLKTEINYDLSSYEELFSALQPCSYFYTRDLQHRHLGFIAQDVDESRAALGMQANDLAAVAQPEKEDGYYGISYSEFVPLLVYMLQKLYKRVEALEKQTA